MLNKERKSLEVHLNETELLMAGTVGLTRQISCIRKKSQPSHGHNDENPWQIAIEGVCGEMAVAKALNIYATLGVNTFKEVDLPNMQIRTRSQHNYDLLVRPNDKDDEIFVHVTGKNGRYVVHGWMRGSDAKQPEFLKEHGGRPSAYFVPANELRCMSDLAFTILSH